MMAKIILASTLVSTPYHFHANAEEQATTSNNQFYGLQDGRLQKCKTLSNCISTSSVSSLDKYGRPWKYNDPSSEEFAKLVDIIKADPYLKLAEYEADKLYVHVEAKSAFPVGSIDDIEFLLNDRDKIITYRSNSRDVTVVGGQVVGDGGANRNRLAGIKDKLKVEEMGVSDEVESFMKTTKKRSFLDQLRIASTPNEINFIDNSVPDT